jgi:hypothetical protein
VIVFLDNPVLRAYPSNRHLLSAKCQRPIALNIATLITPVFSRPFIEQDSVYKWIKFGCKLPQKVAQFWVQINKPDK